VQKIVIHKPGGYNRLQLEEHPSPVPGQDQVKVLVKAAGINYADVVVRWGLYSSAKKYVGWPITPGFEFAGEVAHKAKGFKKGERVFGVMRFGAYASEVVVDRHQVFKLPGKLNFAQGAGFWATFLTAYHALFQHVVIRPQMKVLVHSAAGGVGTALLQLAKIANLGTMGVVGATHKVRVAEEMGATSVVDKSTQNLWQQVEHWAPLGVDLIFDANGISTLRASYEHLAPMGKLFTYGAHSMLPKKGGKVNFLKLASKYLRTPKFNSLEMGSLNRGVIGFNLSYLFEKKKILAEATSKLLTWLNKSKLRPSPVTTYPLAEVAGAHADLESGKTIGKLVLLMP